jgi:hypothetical protein
MPRTMSEEHREAARQRMKAMHERKRAEKAGTLRYGTSVPEMRNMVDPENSTEIPQTMTELIAQSEMIGEPIRFEWKEMHKKLDAILDVLTKLVPMIKVEAPPTKQAEDDILADLRIRITTNQKIKDLKLKPDQVFKRIGVDPNNLPNAVIDNRAYWDDLNLRLVEMFMKVKK